MADTEGLVTLVISVYNIERLLPKCLESVAAQTYRNLEVLLVDDGSSDGSGRICDEFAATDSRVRVIHQENRGLWAVRNRGLAESKGEFITFPDGDDYFHKDYVRLMYEAITSGDYQLAVCDYRRVDDYEADTVSDSRPVVEEMSQEDLLGKIRDLSECQTALWGANWNKLYRKSALPAPFQRNYRRCQDFDSNLRVFFQVNRAVFVRKELYYWYQWEGQATRIADITQVRNECRCQIYYDNYRALPEQVAGFKRHLIVNLYRRLLFWKNDSRGTADEQVSARKIREYQKKTWPYFLFRAAIPFYRRVHWLLALNAPGLVSFLTKFYT